MKTRIILFAIGASSLLLSCSTDRDEPINNSSTSKHVELKNEKITTSKSEVSKIGDSLSAPQPPNSGLSNSNGTSIIPPPTGIDPDPVVDPTKPDKPW